MQASEILGNAALTVTGADPDRIRALGFIGVMTVGMHHQAHHLALATGQTPTLAEFDGDISPIAKGCYFGEWRGHLWPKRGAISLSWTCGMTFSRYWRPR